MVPSAKQSKVGERRGAAVRPMANVMTLRDPNAAPGESTSLIPLLQGPPQRRRDGPSPGPHLRHATVSIMAHEYAAGVTGESLRRFRGNVGAFLQHRLPRRRFSQHFRVNVDHDLIALTGGPRVEPLVERRLGDQCHRVYVLLRNGRRLQRALSHASLGIVATALVEHLAPGLQRAPQEGSYLRCQPPPHHHHAVLIGEHVERAASVLLGLLGPFRVPIHPPPPPDDSLDVRRRPRPPHLQEPALRLRRSHPGQRPHLGVGQFTSGQCPGEERQRRQRPCDPDPLASRTQIEAHPPAQPLRARAEPGVPAAAGVELADEVEQPRGGGVQVRRQLGNLVAEPVQIHHRVFHGASPLGYATSLTPRISGSGDRPGAAIRKSEMIRRDHTPDRQAEGTTGRAGGHRGRVIWLRGASSGEAVKRKMWAERRANNAACVPS